MEQLNKSKLGRPGNRIATAFADISHTPKDLDVFLKEHQIGLATIRQTKRFDTSGATGKIHIVKAPTGGMVIYRDKSTS